MSVRINKDNAIEFVRQKVLSAFDDAFDGLDLEGTVIDADLPELFVTIDGLLDTVLDRETQEIIVIDNDGNIEDDGFMELEEEE